MKKQRPGIFSRLPFALRRLMNERICDVLEKLGASSARNPIKRHVENLYEELHDAGVKHLRPDVYLGDEWFSPGGIPAIAVPFYLAHTDLKEIEFLVTNSIEGGTPAAMRKLLRHEAGHSFDHGYKIARDLRWRNTFGRAPSIYRPEVYMPDSTSLNHVKHLPDHYAQSHPDEDFAETFAVAITPGLDWESRYAGRSAVLGKLHYVQSLIRRHGSQRPRERDIVRTYDARRLRMTLARYYDLRLAREARWQRMQSRLVEA